MKYSLLLSIAVTLGAIALPVSAAWQTTEGDGQALAWNDNDHGQRIELFVDDRNAVFLRIRLSDGFETFAAANCPTFQIDTRQPMHHFSPGEQCQIEAKHVTFALGTIVNRRIRSLILHRILNGNAVTFRYTVSDGQYRKSTFSLSRSKQAMRTLLGYRLEIEAEPSGP